MQSRSARIRAFRAYQKATPEERERMTKEGFGRPDLPSQRKSGKEWTPVHLLSADEVKSLFQDVVEGLGFLVGSCLSCYLLITSLLDSTTNQSFILT